MQVVKYMDFLPGGNKTALVMGGKYDAETKRIINDAIMAADPEIEQVGFVKASDPEDFPQDPLAAPSLEMAGGEFCGNATRSAAYYYLQGRPGALTMTVSGGNQVRCGVHENGDAWCEIPLLIGNTEAASADTTQTVAVAPGIYKVRLSGITHLVLEPETAAPFLESCAADPEKLKAKGLEFIEKYGLMDEEAAGAVFLEKLPGGSLKIHPIVRVRDIDSLFYETACGSGTVAAAMVLARQKGADISAGIQQPSGMFIRAEITLAEDGTGEKTFSRAVISGLVITDMKPRDLQL